MVKKEKKVGAEKEAQLKPYGHEDRNVALIERRERKMNRPSEHE